MASNNSIHFCRLCGEPVDIASCQTDEHGKAVHGTCYTTRLTLEDGTPQSGDGLSGNLQFLENSSGQS